MGEIILDRAAQLDSISTIVSIVVILLLTLTLGGLFALYYHYYSKCITHEVEDDYLKKEVISENNKYFRQTETMLNNRLIKMEIKRQKIIPLEDFVEKKSRSNNKIKIIANTFLVVFYLCFASLMGFAIYVKSSGDLFAINNTSCLIIKSGSMEERNSNNKYLFENDLNNQIDTYSLIGIEKVSEENLSLYDIVAFKDKKGNIIVHRIIEIKNQNGKTFYMTRGDSNSASASYELNLSYSDIIGRYNGFQSFGLGIVIYYFQSGIGLITLAFGLILVGFYDILDIYLGKKIKDRKKVIYVLINKEISTAIDNEEQLPYLTIDYGYDGVEVKETPKEEKVELNREIIHRSFVEKLLSADQTLQDNYNALKNEFLRYPLKTRITFNSENFRYKRRVKGKITIRGKHLRVYLALDPQNYVDTPIPFKDMGEKTTYQKVPLMIKVKSNLSLKRAKALINEMMALENLVPNEVKFIDWVELLRPKIEVPVLEENDLVEEGNLFDRLPKNKRKQFAERILSADASVQEKYTILKKEMLSYRLNSRVSLRCDTFKFHRKTMCKIYISGSSIKVYYALNPYEYLTSTLTIKNVSSKKSFKETPVMIRVKSDLSLKRALILLQDLMTKNEIPQKKYKDVDCIEILKKKLEK